MSAARYRFNEIMSLLVVSGADISLRDNHGSTARDRAIQHGELEAWNRAFEPAALDQARNTMSKLLLEERILPMMIASTLITCDNELQTSGARTDGVALRNQDTTGEAVDVYLRPHNVLHYQYLRRVLSFLDPYGVVEPADEDV